MEKREFLKRAISCQRITLLIPTAASIRLSSWGQFALISLLVNCIIYYSLASASDRSDASYTTIQERKTRVLMIFCLNTIDSIRGYVQRDIWCHVCTRWSLMARGPISCVFHCIPTVVSVGRLFSGMDTHMLVKILDGVLGLDHKQ